MTNRLESQTPWVVGGPALLLAAAVTCACALHIAQAQACGTERWPVKVGTDQDAGSVDIIPRLASVQILSAVPPPAHPKLRNSTRYPLELKTYTITGTVQLVRLEADDDYHVVISDGHSAMIVAFPLPACAAGSPFQPLIAAVRARIEAKMGGALTAEGQSLSPNWTATVTGIGFFDDLHGQAGVARNGVELHPVLDVSFR
ncbi:MAG TPA: hypothetical protein VKQ29_15220 [Aliidongia sp.]|nr:hypothetical protein [Aliidongia sp.]